MTDNQAQRILTELEVIKERTKALPELQLQVQQNALDNAYLRGSVRVLTWALPSGAALALGALTLVSRGAI